MLFSSCKKEKNDENEAVTKTICVGYQIDESKQGYIRAVIWEDGKQSNLSEDYSAANNVLIAENNVYVSGYIDNQPVYWKNGVRNLLPFDGSFGSAGKMSVNNANRYITGNIDGKIALWKNDVLIKTIPKKDSQYYYSPLMHQDNFYFIVSEVKGGVVTSSYFKNETAFSINGSENCQIYQIGVTGADVYLVGTDMNRSEIFVWKNNIKKSIAKSEDTSIAKLNVLGLETEGNDVYVFYAYTSSKTFAATQKCWKNGSEIAFANADDFYPYVSKPINGKIYRGGWRFQKTSLGATYFIDNEQHQLNSSGGYLISDIAVGKLR